MSISGSVSVTSQPVVSASPMPSRPARAAPELEDARRAAEVAREARHDARPQDREQRPRDGPDAQARAVGDASLRAWLPHRCFEVVQVELDGGPAADVEARERARAADDECERCATHGVQSAAR